MSPFLKAILFIKSYLHIFKGKLLKKMRAQVYYSPMTFHQIKHKDINLRLPPSAPILKKLYPNLVILTSPKF